MANQQQLEKLINRLEAATERLENLGLNSKMLGFSSNSNSGNQEAFLNSPSIIAYDNLVNSTLKTFLDSSVQISPDVASVADMVKKLFDLQRNILIEATRCSKPTNDTLAKALEPFSKQIQEIQAFRDKNRKSEFFNHISGISEAIGAFAWLTIEPAPCPYIKEMIDAGQFYTNRVLKDYREKDKKHATWVQTWLQLLNELQAYVKQFHTTGVSWNAKGSKFDPQNVGTAKAASGGPGLPPPPPPPPSADIFLDNSSQSKSNEDPFAKLKQELNMGTDITKSLKKVTDDQKTHKNPALRAGNTVPGGPTRSGATPPKTVAPTQAATYKPPKFELVDKKWIIENHSNKNDLFITNTEIKQTVYVYQCKSCTVRVQGKVNSIILDSCDRVALVFDDVLSTVEFINSKNVQAQVNGKVPTISIDKTDGCQFYLSHTSLDVEIISAKSSAMNILVPNKNDGDFTEYPLPEQFKSVFKNNKMQTEPAESA